MQHTPSAAPPPLPYLTADLPGIGGVLKQQVEDFEVEEIPAYLPQGDGEFLYLWIEKRGLSAEQLTSHLAAALGIALQDVGMAGMKDRHAVTRQWVSVPRKAESRLQELRHDGIRILDTKPHRNKLRPGHLRGNRFVIVVRDVDPHALEKAETIRQRLLAVGCPNFFGEQRFGREAETLATGMDLLRGTRQPASIPKARRRFLVRLGLSAAQSALFNRALEERMRDGLLDRVLPGDVMEVTASGGKFVVEDAEREQARFDAREIVTTGPMFGPKMTQPQGEPAEREARVLAESGLTAETFTEYKKLTPGTRRPYLVWPADLAISADPRGLRFEFTLPAGVYATVLLREFQKESA